MGTIGRHLFGFISVKCQSEGGAISTFAGWSINGLCVNPVASEGAIFPCRLDRKEDEHTRGGVGCHLQIVGRSWFG